MIWNEQDHPRDEDGKFTFKDGGGSSSVQKDTSNPKNLLNGYVQEDVFNNITDELSSKNTSKLQNENPHLDVLYENTIKQQKADIEKQRIKDELLDILGNKATSTDILYGDEQSLRKKIKEYGLKPFSKDKQQHEILRQLSIYSYDNGHQAIPKGYERVGHFESKNNGFDCVVVKNDSKKQIVIAFRGMEPIRDVPSTVRTWIFNYTSQQKSAEAVYEKIKQDPRFKGYEIQTTGQSLGGYLAQYIAAKNNLKSATFNAFRGTKEALRKEATNSFQTKIIHPHNIVNYRNKEDFLTNWAHGNDVGLSLETDAQIRTKSLNKFEEPHMSENMGDLDTARVKNHNYPNYANADDNFFGKIFLGKFQNFMHDISNFKIQAIKQKIKEINNNYRKNRDNFI